MSCLDSTLSFIFRSQNRVLSLQFLAICIGNVMSLIEESHSRPNFEKLLHMLQSNESSEAEKIASAFGIAMCFPEMEPSKFASENNNDLSMIVLRSLIGEDPNEHQSSLLKAYPFFQEIFGSKVEEVKGPFSCMKSLGVDLFRDYIDPKNSLVKVDNAFSVMEALESFLTSKQVKTSRIAVQVVGIIVVLLDQCSLKSTTTWNLERLPSDSIIKSMIDSLQNTSTSGHLIEAIIMVIMKTEDFPSIELEDVLLNLLATRKDIPTLKTLILKLALSKIEVSKESVKSSSQYISLVRKMIPEMAEEDFMENLHTFFAILEENSLLEILEGPLFRFLESNPSQIQSCQYPRSVDLSKIAKFIFLFVRKYAATNQSVSLELLSWFLKDAPDELQRIWSDDWLLLPQELDLLILLLGNDGLIRMQSLAIIKRRILAEIEKQEEIKIGMTCSLLFDKMPKVPPNGKSSIIIMSLAFNVSKKFPDFAGAFPYDSLQEEQHQSCVEGLIHTLESIE